MTNDTPIVPVSLASGYGNFAVPAVALEAATAALATAQRAHAPLTVAPAAGLPELREALAARYRHRGAIGLTAAQVVVTGGAKTGLAALLGEMLRPGDDVLLPTPNWFGFYDLVKRAGGALRTLRWPRPTATPYAPKRCGPPSPRPPDCCCSATPITPRAGCTPPTSGGRCWP